MTTFVEIETLVQGSLKALETEALPAAFYEYFQLEVMDGR